MIPGKARATLRYSESDHKMMHRVALLETKAMISDKYSWWDVETHYPEKVGDLDKLYGTARAERLRHDRWLTLPRHSLAGDCDVG